MNDKNKKEEEVKLSQNEITEENEIKEEEKHNEAANVELLENNKSIELNSQDKNLIKDEKDDRKSQSNEKENQDLDKNQQKSKDSNSKIDANSNKNLDDESDKNNKPKSKQREKIKDDSISSISSSAYYLANNDQNLAKIKEDLKNKNIKNDEAKNFHAIYDIIEKENKKLEELYKEEGKVNEEIIDKNFIMDDDIFENRTRKILSDIYDLKEYLYYPYFTVEYCAKKKSNMVKIYYYKISIECDKEITNKNNIEDPSIGINNNLSSSNKTKKDKKNELQNKNVEIYDLLDDRETYMLSYKEMPMIFQKNNNMFYSVNIISKDFQSSTEFLFKKEQHDLITSFTLADINKELLDIKGELTRTKNKLDSLKGNNIEKKMLNEKLNIINKMNEFLKKEYSKKNLEQKIKEKKEKLEYYEEKIKLEKLMQKLDGEKEKELETEIKNIKEEVENYEMLLKVITIRITKMDQEFDGLFFSSKKITLKNSIGDTLTIPAKSPIIIEVKNNSNYNGIIDNIRVKKKLLEHLKLKENNFYFIGILRNLNINKEQKKNIDIKKRNLNFSNMIIIYPEKSSFLNVPLYEEKKETEMKSGQNLEEVLSIIMKKIDKMEKDLEEMKKKSEEKKEDKK